MANTDSTTRILRTIAARLLTWEPLAHPDTGTRTLGELLGATPGASDGDELEGALYLNAPPEDVGYPYGLLRMAGQRPQGDDQGFQLRGQAELQLFGWPRSEARDYGGIELNTDVAISAMADLVEQAWRDFVLTAVGDTIVAQRIAIRNNVPYAAPASRELVQERLLLPFYATPAYQAQYSTATTL